MSRILWKKKTVLNLADVLEYKLDAVQKKHATSIIQTSKELTLGTRRPR